MTKSEIELIKHALVENKYTKFMFDTYNKKNINIGIHDNNVLYWVIVVHNIDTEEVRTISGYRDARMLITGRF